jgi:DNA-binding transcriptional ArsR family regulator
MSVDDEGQAAHGSPARLPLREVTDAQTMRALGHPVRIALIEALTLHGPMTATQVGERIGESPTTCSFHLRQLARYGFVEEAGGGKGRARPWRMTTIGFSIAGAHDDPETEIAANALTHMVRERQLGRYANWMRTQRNYPRRWREAADSSQYLFYLTAEELEQFTGELNGLLRNWMSDRLTDPSTRPAGSVPIEVLTFAFPIELPPDATDEQDA